MSTERRHADKTANLAGKHSFSQPHFSYTEVLFIKRKFIRLSKDIIYSTKDYKGVIIPDLEEPILLYVYSVTAIFVHIVTTLNYIDTSAGIILTTLFVTISFAGWIIYKNKQKTINRIKTLINNKKYIIVNDFKIKYTIKPYTKIWYKFYYIEASYKKDNIEYKFRSNLFRKNIKNKNGKIKIYIDINKDVSDYYIDISDYLKRPFSYHT